MTIPFLDCRLADFEFADGNKLWTQFLRSLSQLAHILDFSIGFELCDCELRLSFLLLCLNFTFRDSHSSGSFRLSLLRDSLVLNRLSSQRRLGLPLLLLSHSSGVNRLLDFRIFVFKAAGDADIRNRHSVCFCECIQILTDTLHDSVLFVADIIQSIRACDVLENGLDSATDFTIHNRGENIAAGRMIVHEFRRILFRHKTDTSDTNVEANTVARLHMDRLVGRAGPSLVVFGPFTIDRRTIDSQKAMSRLIVTVTCPSVILNPLMRDLNPFGSDFIRFEKLLGDHL